MQKKKITTSKEKGFEDILKICIVTSLIFGFLHLASTVELSRILVSLILAMFIFIFFDKGVVKRNEK